VWIDQRKIDKEKKKKINLKQLERELSHFDTTFASNMNIILGYTNKIIPSKSLVIILCEDPVILEGDSIVLAKDQKDSTLLGENLLFLIDAQIEAREF